MFSKASYKNCSINTPQDELREPLLVIYSQEDPIEKESLEREEKKSGDIQKKEEILLAAGHYLLVTLKDVFRPTFQAWLLPQIYLKNSLDKLPSFYTKFEKSLQDFRNHRIENPSEKIVGMLKELRIEAIHFKNKITNTYIEDPKKQEIKAGTLVLTGNIVFTIDSFLTPFKPKNTHRFEA